MPELLRRLRARGYIFVTLDSVMDDEASRLQTADRFVGRYGPSVAAPLARRAGPALAASTASRTRRVGAEGHDVGSHRDSGNPSHALARLAPWLERHHARRDEIWLAYYKAHTGKPSVTYVEAVEEALCFGWIDGQVTAHGRRVVGAAIHAAPDGQRVVEGEPAALRAARRAEGLRDRRRARGGPDQGHPRRGGVLGCGPTSPRPRWRRRIRTSARLAPST